MMALAGPFSWKRQRPTRGLSLREVPRFIEVGEPFAGFSRSHVIRSRRRTRCLLAARSTAFALFAHRALGCLSLREMPRYIEVGEPFAGFSRSHVICSRRRTRCLLAARSTIFTRREARSRGSVRSSWPEWWGHARSSRRFWGRSRSGWPAHELVAQPSVKRELQN